MAQNKTRDVGRPRLAEEDLGQKSGRARLQQVRRLFRAFLSALSPLPKSFAEAMTTVLDDLDRSCRRLPLTFATHASISVSGSGCGQEKED